MNYPVIKSPVIYFEMTENSDIQDINLEEYEFVLERDPNIDNYLNLYREIAVIIFGTIAQGSQKMRSKSSSNLRTLIYIF